MGPATVTKIGTWRTLESDMYPRAKIHNPSITWPRRKRAPAVISPINNSASNCSMFSSRKLGDWNSWTTLRIQSERKYWMTCSCNSQP